jgi:hypothetical protein
VGHQCAHCIHLFLNTIDHTFLTERNIECCIHIGMINVSTSRTLKLLSIPLTACTTSGTLPTGICRVYVEDRDTEQLGFVFHEGLQLEERPTVQGILERTVLFPCLADTAQIFKDKCCVLFLSYTLTLHTHPKTVLVVVQEVKE